MILDFITSLLKKIGRSLLLGIQVVFVHRNRCRRAFSFKNGVIPNSDIFKNLHQQEGDIDEEQLQSIALATSIHPQTPGKYSW